jgi:hypothetical protein
MSLRSLSETHAAAYASGVATLDRTPVRQKPNQPVASGAPPSSQRLAQPPSSGAIDHWSYVLFYSMGIGTLAVGALIFTVLVAVWLYGQFVWTFTQWDLADVRLTPFKSLAYLVIGTTFLAGTGAGLWIFSGAAWKNQNTTRTRRSRR